MAKFQMEVTLEQSATRVTARIADSKGNDLNDNDVGKLVKLVGDSQYGLCAKGNEIEGFLQAVENPAKYDGFVLGTVQTDKRFKAILEDRVAVGGLVVAGTPAARNTADGLPKVQAGVPTKFMWRVVAITKGTGDAGSEVTVERM